MTDLPYNGTSGHSGSDTSEARALSHDGSGRTAKWQRAVYEGVMHSGTKGMTVHEVRQQIIEHHGTASGTLSVLHKAEKIERLSERRGGCKVYVTLSNVGGRTTERQGR